MVVDAIIVTLVGLATYLGLRRGIVTTIAGFFGFWAAVAASVYGYRLLAPLLDVFVPRGLANLVAALAIFAAVVLLSWLAGHQLTRVLRWTKWRWVNTAAGGAFGGLWALAWVTVLVLAMNVVPVPESLASSLERSALARGITEGAPDVLQAAARTDLRRLMTSFLPPARSRVTVEATTDFQRAPAAERRLFDLANEERTARGLPTFVWDGRLAQVARAHASDMYLRGFFSHENPDGHTPAQRLGRAGIDFAASAENIALAPNVPIAHNRFMTSDEHRRHVLDRRYTRIGIGVMAGRQGLLIAAEMAG